MTAATFDIIGAAFALAQAVGGFFDRARAYYHAVVLSGYACTKCDGPLIMIEEGRCRCVGCRHEFDPTATFQSCSACGGKLTRQICRYRCGRCGTDVTSKFIFDGRVFDTDYFKVKMAESRKRKQDLREQVRKMLAASRSLPIQPQAGDLDEIPGLVEALNGLTLGLDLPFRYQPKGDFDLVRYQSHIQAHLKPYWIGFDQIPPLSENTRVDRVGRFIAVIFLTQAGVVETRQTKETIEVKRHEADPEGLRIFASPAGLDGLEGSAG